jgi:hypothetical protein
MNFMRFALFLSTQSFCEAQSLLITRRFIAFIVAAGGNVLHLVLSRMPKQFVL